MASATLDRLVHRTRLTQGQRNIAGACASRLLGLPESLRKRAKPWWGRPRDRAIVLDVTQEARPRSSSRARGLK